MPTYVDQSDQALYPSRLIVGEAIDLTITLADYPASTYTLKYALVTSGAQILWTASADGDDHSLEIASATTGAYTAGEYAVQVWVEDAAGDKTYIAEGYLELATAFADEGAGYDARSHVKKTLDALEAMIEGKATKDQMSYSIAGRSLARMSSDEILRWAREYRRRWAEEQAEAQRQSGSTVQNLAKVHMNMEPS